MLILFYIYFNISNIESESLYSEFSKKPPDDIGGCANFNPCGDSNSKKLEIEVFLEFDNISIISFLLS